MISRPSSTLLRALTHPLGAVLAVCALSTCPLRGEEGDTKQIERLVTMLDDDRYDARQRAQRELEQLGQPALDAVADAAETGSLESVTRAVSILLQWSETDDKALQLDVLQRMANLPNRPREAAMASRLLSDMREKEAIAKLTELGAKFEPDSRVHGINNYRVVLNKEWKGGTESLNFLADVPRATTLSLQSADVDDSVFDELSKLPNVQRIELYKTNTTRAAANEFKKQFPQRDVDHRRGAMLGVVGMPLGQGIVTQVEKGSAAERAGIRAGDNITKLDGKAVESFQQLTELIGEFEAGQSATVTVVREDETLDLEVQFGDMADSRMMKPGSGARRPLTPNQIRIIQQNRIIPQNNQQLVPPPIPAKTQPAKQR